MSDTHPLIKAWREFSPRKSPYILKGDECLLKPYGRNQRTLIHKCSTFEEYIANENFAMLDERRLHLGLIPIPYMGHLATARIFVLMLNPGFSELNYHAETHSSEFRKALRRSLHQQIAPNDYPMISLNPRFAWHGGYRYWTNKLQSVLKALCEQRSLTWTDSLRLLAREIAVVQYYPYHSKQFGLPSTIQRSLLSGQLAKRYVHEVLVPKARAGTATIIVTRKSKEWELPKHRNIVVYSVSESRAAHLTLNTQGGRKIAEFLDI